MSETVTSLESFGAGNGSSADAALWRRADEPGIRDGERDLMDLKKRVHARLMEENEAVELSRAGRAELQTLVEGALVAELEGEDLPMHARQRQRVVHDILDELQGYGPLQPFLEDPTITEIMVNGPRRIYIEREGRLYQTDRAFSDNAHVMRVIERIVAPIGRRIDESSPMVDARLPDGSRVNVIIPPLSLCGPVITVRKFARQALKMDDLIRLGTMTGGMARFIQGCVTARLNILVSGGTGSGKTTTLNILSSFIPDGERIVTIEDAAELQLQQPHVVPLETKPANLEGKGEITIRQLVRNSLRMRPDRIIVGEVRGEEALDMLQAMNTGHDGSLSTLHSNTPRDTMSRLETLVLMAGMELPARAIREQISSAIHLLIHQNRLSDGTRRITHITEVQGLEGDVVVLQDVFRWEQQGIDDEGRVIGHHAPTGLRPRCLAQLHAYGVQMPMAAFMPADTGRRR